MKKVFTLFMLLLCAVVGTKAQTTIGLTQANDGVATGDYIGTLAAATYVGTTNVTVDEAHGAGCGINQSERVTTGPDGTYWCSKCFRKTVKSSTWDATEWVGYTVEVASGYKVTLSNLKATLWDANSNASYTWRVVVENSVGTALFTSDSKTSSNNSVATLEVASPSGLSELKTGKYTVKLQLYQNGGNKYFTVPYLTFEATVKEDASKTYTVTTNAEPANAGSVTPETGAQVEGTDVILTATPKTGYKFVKWTVDGVDVADNPYTISKISEDHNAVATFEALPVISFDKGEGNGIAPSVAYADYNTSYELPNSFFLYKENATFKGWNNGTQTYAVGDKVVISADVTFTAVYEDNLVSLGDAETIVNWNFATKDGAPVISCEGAELDYVQKATINDNKIDVLMHINTKLDAGIEGSKGKVNNTSGDNRAQVNGGTVFTIPAIKGMVVKVTATNTGNASVSSMKFDGNDADSYDAGVLTYTYEGSENAINIIDQGSNLYPSGIVVTYPNATKCSKPTIIAGGFSFKEKGYEVTINAGKSSETLNVSTDGTNFSEQTSPYTTYITSETTFYAKDTSSGLSDSDVAELKVTPSESFDSSKPYVAWVYTKGYGAAEYAFETDPMVSALKDSYNVVEVNYAADVTPSTDLNNADLIVCTEAMAGGKTMSNGMKAFVSNTPMIGLKAYNYTKGRWSWGAPANPSPTAQAFTPKSALYKVLDGVTYETDGSINLASATSGNVVQTVSFGTTDTTAPEGNIILGTIGDDDSKAVMYVSPKFFGLGLSSDCWNSYSANAITIVKNAAKMLIAGEDLTATNPVEVAIGSTGYATFSSKSAVDFSDAAVTVYTAKVNGSNAVLAEVESKKVPVNTGVILKGNGTVSGTVIAEADALTNNDLIAATSDVTTTGIYILVPDGESVKFTTMTDGTLKAGKAYLPAASSARELNLVFDEATGISEIKNTKAGTEVYNLNGVRVAQPTKGLYIQNGKKFVK